jgi:hypothetical protein
VEILTDFLYVSPYTQHTHHRTLNHILFFLYTPPQIQIDKLVYVIVCFLRRREALVNSSCHRDYGIPKGEMRGQALTGLTGSLFAEEIDIIEDQTGGEWRMTYERFEDLPVWKRAMDLAEKVYTLCDFPR